MVIIVSGIPIWVQAYGFIRQIITLAHLFSNCCLRRFILGTEHVWDILVVDELNTCCDALISLFCNNYLRLDFKNHILLRYNA